MEKKKKVRARKQRKKWMGMGYPTLEYPGGKGSKKEIKRCTTKKKKKRTQEVFSDYYYRVLLLLLSIFFYVLFFFRKAFLPSMVLSFFFL